MSYTKDYTGELSKYLNSLTELFRALIIDGNIGFISEAIRSIVIRQEAEKERINVSRDELQKNVDMYRRLLGLQRSEDFFNFLDQQSLTSEGFIRRVGRAILESRLKQKLTKGRLQPFFEENRQQFEVVAISQIVVKEIDFAEKLRVILEKKNGDFRRIAREFSIDDSTNLKGGFVGVVSRSDLNPTISDEIFGCPIGEVVGPVKTDKGYHLISVDHIYSLQLDDPSIRVQVQNIVFEDILRDKVEAIRASGILPEYNQLRYPAIKIGNLDEKEDAVVQVKKGIYKDLTSLQPTLSISGEEAVLTLHQTLHPMAKMSLHNHLVGLYETPFNVIRRFPCCGFLNCVHLNRTSAAHIHVSI